MSVPQQQYCVIGSLMDNNDIGLLEKIGLHEVSKKTHIEVKQLQYIINKEYDKLNKINTVGFIKILSREYKLDLSEWLEAYRAYWDAHKGDEETQKEKIFIRAKGEGSALRWPVLIFLLLLCAGVGAYFYAPKPDINVWAMVDKFLPQINTESSGFSNAPVVKEAADSLGVKVEERVVESNSTNTTVQAVLVPLESNQTLEANKTKETVSIEDKPLVKSLPNEAILSPNRKVWVGIIALDSGVRKERNSDQNLTIDLTKRQLIKTGNGYFKLVYYGSVEDFTEQGATRFLVEEGNISKISEEAFLKLNQGKQW